MGSTLLELGVYFIGAMWSRAMPLLFVVVGPPLAVRKLLVMF
ncbi:hypothetical protein ACWIGW_41340 [Nocardia brasiliensis]